MALKLEFSVPRTPLYTTDITPVLDSTWTDLELEELVICENTDGFSIIMFFALFVFLKKKEQKEKSIVGNKCLGWETHGFNNVSFAFLSVVDSESVLKS